MTPSWAVTWKREDHKSALTLKIRSMPGKKTEGRTRRRIMRMWMSSKTMSRDLLSSCWRWGRRMSSYMTRKMGVAGEEETIRCHELNCLICNAIALKVTNQINKQLNIKIATSSLSFLMIQQLKPDHMEYLSIFTASMEKHLLCKSLTSLGTWVKIQSPQTPLPTFWVIPTNHT